MFRLFGSVRLKLGGRLHGGGVDCALENLLSRISSAFVSESEFEGVGGIAEGFDGKLGAERCVGRLPVPSAEKEADGELTKQRTMRAQGRARPPWGENATGRRVSRAASVEIVLIAYRSRRSNKLTVC